MATVRIAVRYSNRQYPRVYDASSNAGFDSVKDAVKATGARFDGTRKWWLCTKAGLDALKAQGYAVKAADFECDTKEMVVSFVATGEPVVHLRTENSLGGWARPRTEDYDRLGQYQDDLQAAYNRGDAALGPVLERIREECARAIVVE